jgi:hypothetical protein
MKGKKKIIGYKGLNHDLTSNVVENLTKYEIGKTYAEDDNNMKDIGFNYSEYPLDQFVLHLPAASRYAEIETSGKPSQWHTESRACAKIKIIREINILELVFKSVNYLKNINFQILFNRPDRRYFSDDIGQFSVVSNNGSFSAISNTANYSGASNSGNKSMSANTGNCSVATNGGYRSISANTGNRSGAGNTGDESIAVNSGDFSVAANGGKKSTALNQGSDSAATTLGNNSIAVNSGERSLASVEGENSVACGLGYQSKARASKGSAIVLAEKDMDGNLINIKAAIVDGEFLKANTLYQLINNKFVEV